jgi:hypothetical protein
MSFNRRLPFSTRYVPIDKQKLIDNKFQLATFAPHLQSLAEKYAVGLGGAATLGAMGYPDAVEKYNQYTIDPIKNWTKEQWEDYKKSDVYKKFRKLDESVGLDFLYDKKKEGGVIEDDRGQWAHPGEITEIGSNQITMQGVPYPVLGISDEGDTQMMYPEQEYKFKGKKVTEYPMAQKGEKVAPIYTDDPKKVQAYNDSLDLYNDYNRLKNILDKQYSSSDYIKKEENFPRNPDGSICYNCIKKEAERKKQVGNFVDNLYGKVQQLANPNINPIGYINYLKDNLFFDESQGKIYNYSNVKPVQPYILQQELQQSKDQPYLSDKEYSKKYPPIYVTNPKDPRIGQYSPEGNEYKYKEQPKSQPTLKKKVSKMEPIRSSYTPSLSLRTIQTPDIELPGIQMGDYEVSYYSPESKDWANRRFTSQEESDRFAQEMSQRGYPGSYGNITQTKKTNKKSTGGWLDKYN